jgi:D-xylose transport system ATP-binding protein
MIEIAKALSKNAALLVLDEPTAALPDADARRLLTLLKELKGRGVTCLYISHRLEEVFEIADRITVLRDGATIATLRKDRAGLDEVISLMVGRKVQDLYPRTESSPGATVFSARDFCVEDPSNRGRFVLKDVSFDVHSGEILGIGGLMGAGRTALLASLFGASRGTVSGRISVLGGPERAPFRNPEEAIRAGVALVSEDRKRYGLVLEEGVGENLTLATLRRLVRAGLIDHSKQEKEASRLVESLKIKTRSLSALAKELSGGNQQKVVLGKWLMTEPKVLFLDEPTRGVDVGAKLEIYHLMNMLASKGVGLVLVSSDLPELLGMSHRVLVLSQGRKTALLDRPKMTPEAVMAAATVKVRDGDSATS